MERDNKLDDKDIILQGLCPTVMVPAFSILPELEEGYRYLMAKDGLWMETRQPWGHFRLPLWKSPRALPYGAIEDIWMLKGGSIPKALISECMAAAALKANEGKEWAGWITWNMEAGYAFSPVQVIRDSATTVVYKYPVLPHGQYCVLDLHSHPFDYNEFSHIDDIDNAGGVCFAGVISFNADMAPKLKIRLCIEGHFFGLGGKYDALCS